MTTNEESPHEPTDAAGAKGPDDFFAEVYNELRSIAHARLRSEKSGYTLQSTELVHEAYLRLAPEDGLDWNNRRHFFATAAEAMRRILIERARAKGRLKRGGDPEGRPAPRVSLELSEVATLTDDNDPESVLALDRMIERLAARDERAAQVVKLRFYAGLTIEEVAEVFETSPRTVLRDWAFARAWLFAEWTREGDS